jgi:biotin transport system substrate-specific component
MTPAASVRMTVRTALLAALIAAGALVAIPIGPVPIVLQNLFVFLAGLLLGARWGLTCIAVYLLAGALGLPVFAGGSGGLWRLVGPTGGYLLGYLPAVAAIGWIAGRQKPRPAADALAVAVGGALVYACGLPWLMQVTGMGLEKALAAGMLPFLPGDLLKGAAAVIAARKIRPVLERTLP